MTHPGCPRRRLVPAIVIAAAATCGLAACGSSSSPSPASFDRQANAICAADKGQIQSLANLIGLGTPGTLNFNETPAGLASELRAGRAAFEGEHRQLTALHKPSGNTAAINRALGDQQTVVAGLPPLITALQDNQPSATDVASGKLSSVDNAYSDDFRAAGLTACATSSPTGPQ